MHRCSHRARNEAATLSKKRREIDDDKLHKDEDDGEDAAAGDGNAGRRRLE